MATRKANYARIARRATYSRDFYLSFLKEDLYKYRFSSFETCGLAVGIYQPERHAKPIVNNHGVTIGVDRYVFEHMCSNEKPTVMRVRATKHGMQILMSGCWVLLEKYLIHLRPQEDWTTAIGGPPNQDNRYWYQARWWLGNDKYFRLLDLPAEIRELIYESTMTSMGRTRVVQGTFDRPIWYEFVWDCAETNTHGLMLSCKQVREEAMHVLHNRVPCVMPYPPDLAANFWQDANPLMRLPTAQTSGSAKKVMLSFKHEDFLDYFQHFHNEHWVRHRPYILWHRDDRKLVLNFGPPIPAILGNGYRSWSCVAGLCQKSVVEEILARAAPFVLKHRPALTGYVKASTHAMWARLIAEEEEKVRSWQRKNLEMGREAGQADDYYEQNDEQYEQNREEGWFNAGLPGLKKWDHSAYLQECKCKAKCGKDPWTDSD